MLVRVGNLAGHDQLDACKERIGDARFAGLAGILKHQNTTLGLLGGDDITGLQHQLFDLAKFPQRREHLRLGFGRDKTLEHFPEWRQMIFRDLFVISLPRACNVVLGTGSIDRKRHGCAPSKQIVILRPL